MTNFENWKENLKPEDLLHDGFVSVLACKKCPAVEWCKPDGGTFCDEKWLEWSNKECAGENEAVSGYAKAVEVLGKAKFPTKAAYDLVETLWSTMSFDDKMECYSFFSRARHIEDLLKIVANQADLLREDLLRTIERDCGNSKKEDADGETRVS